MRTAVIGALTGLLSAGAAVASGDLVASFAGPASAPVPAVGSAAIDLTPTGVKDGAIQHGGGDGVGHAPRTTTPEHPNPHLSQAR